jgi:chemotaxis protein histidine kinase CheA
MASDMTLESLNEALLNENDFSFVDVDSDMYAIEAPLAPPSVQSSQEPVQQVSQTPLKSPIGTALKRLPRESRRYIHKVMRSMKKSIREADRKVSRIFRDAHRAYRKHKRALRRDARGRKRYARRSVSTTTTSTQQQQQQQQAQVPQIEQQHQQEQQQHVQQQVQQQSQQQQTQENMQQQQQQLQQEVKQEQMQQQQQEQKVEQQNKKQFEQIEQQEKQEQQTIKRQMTVRRALPILRIKTPFPKKTVSKKKSPVIRVKKEEQQEQTPVASTEDSQQQTTTQSPSQTQTQVQAPVTTPTTGTGGVGCLPTLTNAKQCYIQGLVPVVKKALGGGADADYIHNTCAMKMSHLLNCNADLTHQPQCKIQRKSGLVTVPDKSGDRLALRVRELLPVMKQRLGTPTLDIKAETRGVDPNIFKGKAGIVVFDTTGEWDDAT